MFDLGNSRHETPIALADAVQHLPTRRGRKIHHSTIFRWATKGVRGRILETWLVGGVRYTTLEALQRFFEAPAASRQKTCTDEAFEVNLALDRAGL